VIIIFTRILLSVGYLVHTQFGIFVNVGLGSRARRRRRRGLKYAGRNDLIMLLRC